LSERAFHRQVADFLRLALFEDAWWTTFPLGGGGKARGGILKAAGAKIGTPDVLVIFAGRAHWIELKTKSGEVSPAQSDAMRALEKAGCPCAIARSLDDVIFALKRWQIPMRARAA
jgi:hypothetical protein